MPVDSTLTPETIRTIGLVLSLAAAGFCLALAFLVNLRDRRSFVHRVFAFGMVALAVEQITAFLASGSLSTEAVILRQRLRWTAATVIPGTWLLFSLSFARHNYRHFLTRWRWPLVFAFVLPLGLALGGDGLFFETAIYVPESGSWLLPVGWVGLAFFVLFLLSYIAILGNLEATLLGSTGRQRWQIKFVLFGIGCLFALRLYTTSQTLLYSTVDTQEILINSAALLLACFLSAIGLARSHLVYPDIYLSRSFLSGSITLSLAGIYLLIVGLMAQGFRSWDRFRSLPLDAFVIFVALCALAILLRSDRVRRSTERFVTLHLKRPKYDYRQVWTEFTRWTASLIDEKELARVTARFLSNTLSMLSVSVWLVSEKQERLVLAGSTAVSSIVGEAELPAPIMQGIRDLVDERAEPIDFQSVSDAALKAFGTQFGDLLGAHHIRVCARLRACNEMLGVVTLGERVGGDALTLEDLQLLQTIANQAASLLLNQRTAERVRKIREQEAFHNIAAFLIHDLKNVASGLSLTVQNLPRHFDNPNFREHAIKVIRESLDRMNGLCKRLSAARRQAELDPRETDLNRLVQEVVCGLEMACHSRISQELRPLPSLYLDPEQIAKVLTNLLVNANQAAKDAGQIVVSTDRSGDAVEISVSDDGCGMSADFIRDSLFRPFQTTKKDGMGIGLYQSRLIVEAHGGRIGVQSEENRGTVFRVTLPAVLEFRPPAVPVSSQSCLGGAL